MFYAVPALIAAVAFFIAGRTVVSTLRLRAAWRSGLTAEARCLRMYTTSSRDSDSGRRTTTLHHVYAFTPAAGRPVRFEESGGPGTRLEGDFVTVHYTAERPERATALPPAAATRTMLGALFVIVFCAVMVLFCLVFVTTYVKEFAS